jgi:hypothetical protein
MISWYPKKEKKMHELTSGFSKYPKGSGFNLEFSPPTINTGLTSFFFFFFGRKLHKAI